MFLRTDWTQSCTDDTTNPLSIFAVSNQVWLIGASYERLFMYEFMNDRTRLIVGYLSPSVCFTTTTTVINKDVHGPIISQSSTPILKCLSSTSVILSFTQNWWMLGSHITRWGIQDYCFWSVCPWIHQRSIVDCLFSTFQKCWYCSSPDPFTFTTFSRLRFFITFPIRHVLSITVVLRDVIVPSTVSTMKVPSVSRMTTLLVDSCSISLLFIMNQ